MIKAYYKVSKFNKGGRRICKGRKILSRSFVFPFMKYLYLRMGGTSYAINDVTNIPRNIYHDNSRFEIVPSHGDNQTNLSRSYVWGAYSQEISPINSQWGIVVGTGITAVHVLDYKLEYQISGGTGTNQLVYEGTFLPLDVTTSSPTVSFNMERMFINSTASPIVVREIGLYPISTYTYCFIRDVLLSAVTVNGGEYLKVTYTIQTTI